MKILLEGYFGYGNVGDEAICASMINELEERYGGQCDIVILSINPYRSIKIHDKRAVMYKIISKEFISEFITMHKLIFCGGGRYGKYTHRKMAILTLLAKILGKIVEFRSIGFYPFGWEGQPIIRAPPQSVEDKITKLLVRLSFNLADKITVRDEFSKKCLVLSGIKKEIKIEEDLALRLKPLDVNDIEKILHKYSIDIEGKKIYIGLNLRTLNEQANKQIIAFLNSVLKPIIKKHEDYIEVIFVPFGLGSFPERFFDDDRIIANMLKEELNTHSFKIIQELNPEIVLTIFKLFDIFIGERLHSICFAIRQNIPIIPIIYDVKVEEFLNHYGYNRILERIYCNNLNYEHALKVRLIIENVIKKLGLC
jgi:polysaccharide pyruvyl transferase WcaK-like protein